MNFQEILESNLFDVICFIIGIIIGLLLSSLIYILIISINKKIVKNKRKKTTNEIVNIDTSEEINYAVNKFYQNHKQDKFSLKIKNTMNICSELVEKIAEKYHPDSSNPLGEVSVKDLINVTKKVEKDIVELIYSILDHKLFKILYSVLRKGYNTINFFRKDSYRIEEKDPKNLHISDIIKIIEQVTSKEKKTNSKDITDITLLNNIINNKVEAIICRIGYYANNTFSKGIE